MKRKKQGASLIIVVIVFMFVSTVSMAMLSMVAGNYKARVVESKRVENLYASDSGLDVAYNIIGKTFDAATKYGYYEVEALKRNDRSNKGPNDDKYKDIEDDITDLNITINALNDDIQNLKDEIPSDTTTQSDINKEISQKNKEIAQNESLIEEDKNLKQLLLDEEFKRAFKNFIATPSSTSELGTDEVAPNKLEQSIEGGEQLKPKYVSQVNFDDTTKTINFTEETIDFGIKNNKSPELEADVGDLTNVSEDEPPVEISDGHSDAVKNLQIIKSGNQKYDNITVASTFYTEKVINNGEEKEVNQRQLKATYKMSVPNYKDIYFENSNEGLNDLATKDRALTIYGDMNVNNVTGLTVDGEIFVQGSDDHSTDNKVYGKYFGGITVKNSDEVIFEKNVITRGTFNIETPTIVEDSENPKTTTISTNLYAKNVYVGKTDGTGLPNQPSKLVVNAGIINNDLTLNANDATIEIDDLYGINDIDLNNKAKSSSSIIVNGNNNSTITIFNSAYLMGTAHIATVGDYQTAESGAVKGNYIAYSVPLNESEKFAYYNPLQLLEPSLYTTQPALSVKENHFIDYWNQPGKNPSAGGIHWPDNSNNIYSIGAIVCETNDGIEINGEKKCEIIPSHYNADLETTGAVYLKRKEFAKYDYKFGQDANIDDYTNSNVISFDSLIDTSKIPTKYNLTDGEYAIFNGNVGKEIKITKSTTNHDVIDSTTDSNVINIRVGNSGILNAIIATAGKVSIESDVTINGCIIAKGDLDINGDNVKINYDSDVIERVQSQNFDTFKAIFGESIDITDTPTDSTSADGATNYDLKNFLENKLWKIIN